MNKGRLRLWVFVSIVLQLFLPSLNADEGDVESLISHPDATISLDLQDASLKDILKIFSVQSGLNFIASESMQDRKVTLYLDKVPLRKAMDQLFKANNLSYELDREANIIIVKDWGKAQLETITRVYPLKYASVAGSILKKEAEKSVGGGPVSGQMNSSLGDLMTILKDVLSPNGKVSEDKRTNSIIITDIPSRFPIIEEVIAKLDVSQPQVLLEVEILDVNKNLVDKVGIKWGDSSSQSLLKAAISGAIKSTAFPFGSFNPEGTKLSSTITGGSVSFVNTYNILLDFFRSQTDTRYLARPRVLTLNNETAEIAIVKDEVVGLKQTTVTGTSSTSTVEVQRASDLKFTSEGVGVFLRVTPQINVETNEITMVVNPKSSVTTASSFTINSQTQADPEVRATKSIVKVKDGETIVLSGLIFKDKQIARAKLPILGDIPVLGALFRHKNLSKDMDRELLIFITPRIIRDTNMALAQTAKMPLPLREQDTRSGIERKAIINSALNNFEKPR